jgi:hypothetical protein
MDVRRAELALAEAKLSVADATDSQIASTVELNDKQTLLNETIFGATIGSLIYDEVLQSLNDAKERQLQAAESLADAIDKEREAQEKLNETIKATIDLINKYPKVLGGASSSAGMPEFIQPNDPRYNLGAGANKVSSQSAPTIVVNAAIADAGLPQLIVDALKTYNNTIGTVPVRTK